MSVEVRGKVCIITGASSGLGQATARLLAQHGARLVLGARRVDRIAALAAELQAMGRMSFFEPPMSRAERISMRSSGRRIRRLAGWMYSSTMPA